MTHTPGPWEAKYGEDGIWYVLIEPNTWVEAGPPLNQVGSRELSEADARLLASAPDLLAALKDWLEAHEDSCRRAVSDTGGCSTCPDIRAAIARAEGA